MHGRAKGSLIKLAASVSRVATGDNPNRLSSSRLAGGGADPLRRDEVGMQRRQLSAFSVRRQYRQQLRGAPF